jgi:hypothetical protein
VVSVGSSARVQNEVRYREGPRRLREGGYGIRQGLGATVIGWTW